MLIQARHPAREGSLELDVDRNATVMELKCMIAQKDPQYKKFSLWVNDQEMNGESSLVSYPIEEGGEVEIRVRKSYRYYVQNKVEPLSPTNYYCTNVTGFRGI